MCKMIGFVVTSLITVYLLSAVVCPPVTQPPVKPEEDENEKNELNQLTYENYLQEVMSLLMSDSDFSKRMMETAGNKTGETGEIAKHLDFVGHGIRTKLDEFKRKELDRLRQVMRLKAYLQSSLKASHPGIVLPEIDKERLLGHLDGTNPNSFEVADLAKLIQKASKDLGEIDKKRKEEFKNYEMEKEHLRRQQLEGLNEAERVEEEKKFKEMEKKHDDHPKLHHPGNEEQLKEVWEESDGLSKKDFDPKTFFHLHDSNGDGFLDSAEVEALFQKELDKVYDPNAPEDDMQERYEEMNRMREHFVNEIDRNKDSMISIEEFIESTQREEFKKDEEWQPLESEDVFNEEDLVKFEKNYDQMLKQKELEQQKLERIRINLEQLGHSSLIPHQARQNVAGNEIPQGGEKHEEQPVAQEGQHVQQPVQHVVAHEQPLMHGQQPGGQPVQHMQQHHEQPVQQHHEQPVQQHHEQPVQQQHEQPVQQQHEQPVQQDVVHEQPIVQQPVAHEQPNVQEPVVVEQHAQQPVAHNQQPVVDEQQHIQQPVVQDADSVQVQQQPLVVQDPEVPPAQGHSEG